MINSVDRYAAPTLTVYGSMVKLTASGVGASCENGTAPTPGTGKCNGGGNVPNLSKKP